MYRITVLHNTDAHARTRGYHHGNDLIAVYRTGISATCLGQARDARLRRLPHTRSATRTPDRRYWARGKRAFTVGDVLAIERTYLARTAAVVVFIDVVSVLAALLPVWAINSDFP